MRRAATSIVVSLQLLSPALTACGKVDTEMRVGDNYSDRRSAQLAQAVLVGDVAEIEAQVSIGASPNAVDKHGFTMLDVALNHGQKGSFRKLLDLNANPNQVKTSSGSTSLHWAALNADPFWVQALIDAGANPNLENAIKETPIFEALSSKSTTVLDVLIEAGANVNHQNTLGQTPAASAAITFDYDMVLYLLRRGACIRIRDQFGDDLTDILAKRIPADVKRRELRQEVQKFIDQNPSPKC